MRTKRKSPSRHAERKGGWDQANEWLKGIEEGVDQEARGVESEGWDDREKEEGERLTDCREGEDQTTEVGQVWDAVTDPTFLIGGKVLNHVVEIWVNNLKIKVEVGRNQGNAERERKIERNLKTKSDGDQVEKASWVIVKVLTKRGYRYWEWVKGKRMKRAIYRKTAVNNQRMKPQEGGLHWKNWLLTWDESYWNDWEAMNNRNEDEINKRRQGIHQHDKERRD